MTVGVFWHPDIFLHDMHARHVAMDAHRIQRIAREVLAVKGTHACLSSPASMDQLLRVHDADYLALLASSETECPAEQIELAPDTELNQHTWRAISLSAGGACQAVEAVLANRYAHAFNMGYAGHHAEWAAGGGFCFINTTLVAALHAQAMGVGRVAVLDFDVHSGNGTVLGLLARPEFLFAETYQRGYPGAFLKKTSRPAHILRKKCERRDDVIRAWSQFFGTLAAWSPQLLVVSAGFDAHRQDPLGTLGLLDSDYEWIAKGLLGLGAPVVANLEGGYSEEATPRCAALFASALAGSSQV